HTRMADVAGALVLRFPTGNPHDYQGTGVFEISPLVFVSTPSVELAPGMRAAVHLNAGLDLVPSDGSSGEGRYGIGVDVTLVDRPTLSVAFLGREPFSGLGSFAVPRADGSNTPLFNISPGHPSYYDVSVGVRVDLWHDTIFGVANVLVPVNQDGVRAGV